MGSYYWVIFIGLILLFVIIPERRNKRIAAVHHVLNRKKERGTMKEFAKQFIGKECIIYTITSNDGSLQCTVREISDGGMLVEDTAGQLQAVNLEYVTRIREYPRNKKGKKKSVVLD